jgi:tellurite resistance-related uncharacterized protein
MINLPGDVRAYKRTETFTETTVPKALLNAHATKAGAWGLIHVLDGELIYRITDPRRPCADQFLSPEAPAGVIEPTVLHEVELLGPVRFYVEFYRAEAA